MERRMRWKDETPYAVKAARTVWSGGKDGDNFKGLIMAIYKTAQAEDS